MERLKQLQQESVELNMLEVSTRLVHFFKENYSLTAFVDKYNNYLDIYLSDVYKTREIEDKEGSDAIASKLMKFYNKELNPDKLAIAVWPTEYGYVIVFDTDEANEEKMLNESLLYYYWYAEESDNESNNNIHDLKRRMVKENKEMDALKELERGADDVVDAERDIKSGKTPKKSGQVKRPEKQKEDIDVEVEPDVEVDVPAVDKHAIEDNLDPSNVILDNKFIWFFTVANEVGDELAVGIENLDDAIAKVVELDAAILVAIPYVDPDPENDDVDIIPADVPGPQFIFVEDN